jgi:hypothetical protein
LSIIATDPGHRRQQPWRELEETDSQMADQELESLASQACEQTDLAKQASQRRTRLRAEEQVEPEGRVRWCWLTRGAASLMVQGFVKQGDGIVMPKGKLGEGILLCFQCEDAVALYHEFRSRSIEAEEPFVGNSMWVTVLRDPDGYKLDVESPTNVPEDTTLSEFETSQNA